MRESTWLTAELCDGDGATHGILVWLSRSPAGAERFSPPKVIVDGERLMVADIETASVIKAGRHA